MTIIRPHDLDCAICGKSSAQLVTYSDTYSYPPNLDGGGDDQVDRLSREMEECPHCGFVSRDIELASYAERNYWLSDASIGARTGWRPRESSRSVEEWRLAMERNPRVKAPWETPSLWKRFVRRARIDEAVGDLDTAAWHMLKAAWTVERRRPDDARTLRSRSADLYLAAIAEAGERDQPGLITPTLDVLRRARRFREATALADRLLAHPYLPSDASRIAKFQRARAETEDDACYQHRDVEAFHAAGGVRTAP